MRRWPGDVKPCLNLLSISFKRRRWESNPLELLCRQSPCRLAPASQSIKCPRQESNLVFDLRRVACESGTLRGQFLVSVPRRGIEPRLAVSKTAVLIRHTRRAVSLDQESNLVRTFGGPCDPYTIGTPTFGGVRTRIRLGQPMRSATPSGHQSRRLDLHQHRSGLQDRRLSQFGHVGASTSARIRTPSGGFGDCLLSQEHTRVRPPGPSPVGDSTHYFSSATFQYASLTNFDQLSIRTLSPA